MRIKNYTLQLIVAVLLLPLLSWGQTNEVTTLAGGTFLDGSALDARFINPSGTAVDGAGNVYVADRSNHRIRKISPVGVVTTLAGSGIPGYADGIGTAARFNSPSGVALDGAGNVYVADQANHCIRKISPAGMVTTHVGSGFSGICGGYYDGTGTVARFSFPSSVSVDGAGNVYVADRGNNCIRKISPTRVVTTFAGSGVNGYNEGCVDATGTGARFNAPSGIAIDGAGNVYVADQFNHRIRKISPIGVVTTLAGSGDIGFYNGGYAEGPATAARFNSPTGVAVDGAGNAYVADQFNNCIRKISPTGMVTTLAGSGEIGNSGGYADGTGTAARFSNPSGLAVDGAGNVYVADQFNHRIRKISPNGVVITLAGAGIGYADGTGTAARFNAPNGVAIDGAGNVYVADRSNNRIRKINPAGVVTTFAGSGRGYAEGTGTAARFCEPSGIAVDVNGNVYVADAGNHRIRKISPDGVVTTLAGSTVYGNVDGTGTSARFYYPSGVAVDAAGNVYVADRYNHRIRKISPAGVVTTLAGSGVIGFDGGGFANGTGTAARFNFPTGVAVDGPGNVYVADHYNHRIRKISPTRVVTTFAGSGESGYGWGFGTRTGTAALFSFPAGVAVDGIGNVYVADAGNSRIRIISPDGFVSAFAGSGTTGYADGTGMEALFSFPTGVAIDGARNVYVADHSNHAIRKISVSVATSTQKKSPTITKFEMFPNPTTDKVTIRTMGTGTLEIVNVVGQVVITLPATETNEIDVSKLTHGVYIVRFNGASQKLVVR